MKNCIILFKSALLLSVLPACNNAANEAKQDAESLSQYVDSVNQTTPEYTNAYWAAIESGYQARLTELKVTEAELSEADRKSWKKAKISMKP